MIWFSVKRNHLTRNGLIFALLVGFSTLAVIFRSLPDLDTLDDCESAFCTARELFRFSAAPTFTCPSPHAHPGWTRPAKIDKLDCTPAETAHDSPWAVQICPWPDTCNSASVLIQLRGHATCDVQRQLSENEELDQHIRKVWGPAEFRLQVEGAEKFSTGQGIFNSETCSYRYDIALATAGDAELSLWQFFEDYKAMDEVDHEWPEMLRKPVLTANYTFPPCPSSCPQYFAPAVPGPEATIDSVVDDGTYLPSCRKPMDSAEIHGAYLSFPPGLSHNDFYPLAPNVFGHVSGRYGFQPSGCQLRHAGTLYADHSACLRKPKRMAFFGDSHGRVLFDSTLHRLGGKRHYNQYSDKAGDKHGTAGELDLSFTWDPVVGFLNTEFTCDSLAKYDALLVSTGSHQAGGQSTRDFEASLSFIDKLASCHAETRLILALPPPQPPRIDDYVKQAKDHRTDTRLTHWGSIIRHRARAARRWMVLDQMAILEAYSFDPLKTDSAHYLEVDGLEAAIDIMLLQSDLCTSNTSDDRQ